MAKITKLFEKNNRIQVFIDDKYLFSCSHNFVISEKLYVGQVIEEAKVNELKESASKTILELKLMEYAFRNRYSERELNQKLKTYSTKKFGLEISDNDFQKKLKELEKLEIYNPKSIINNFVELYIARKKGRRFIQSKLYSKGFDKDLIKEILDKKTNSDYTIQLKDFLEKRKPSLERKAKGTYDLRQRLVKAAMARGFDYGLIKEILDKNSD